MRPNDIYRHVHKRPFQAFRMTLTDGRVYEVRHPEMVMVGLSSVIIGFPADENGDPVFERAVDVSLLHIMQIEPLASSAPPPSTL